MLTGCSGNPQVAGYEDNFDSLGNPRGDYWTSFLPPRVPENLVEKAVIRAAQTRKSISVGNSDVIFICKKGTDLYVDDVERSLNTDRFVEKKITRYRVTHDLISAKSAASMEIFPDADFEITVLLVAEKARTIDRVLLYRDGNRNVSLSSLPVADSDCATLVNIYDAGDTGMDPIAKKMVNFCFDR